MLLTYDRNLLLRAIEPPVPILGWEPQEIIGTYFAPAGTDRDAALHFFHQLWSAEFIEFHGDFQAVARDGSVTQVHASSTVDRDHEGHFDGLRSRWLIPGDSHASASG